MMVGNISDLSYLIDMMNGKKPLIKGVIDDFLILLPEDLESINDAVKNTDYAMIKKLSHSMKSSVSIMGINEATNVLKEMESLSASEENPEKIKVLNHKLNSICQQAIEEIEKIKHNYS